MVPLTPIEMIMIDTSVWVALLDKGDSLHKKAKDAVRNVQPNQLKIFDHIYIETLTVIRNKVSDFYCEQFIKFLKNCNLEINLTSRKILTLATFLFFQFKKLSFPDCLIMASAKINKAELITFDKALKKAWEYTKATF